MVVDWDDDKNVKNFKKHGVCFEEAATVFTDPLAKTALDNYPLEERYVTIGLSEAQRLILVIHSEVSEEQIRVISARGLTRKEKNDYEEGI